MNSECLTAEPDPGLLIESSVILTGSSKADKQKLTSDQEQDIPPTPSFNLFSKVLDLKGNY